MDLNENVKLSEILICIEMILLGVVVGINIGSQLFSERPDFINILLIGLVFFGGALIRYVKRKENENIK